jgi:DNA-binding transcriptional LysR family regulator
VNRTLTALSRVDLNLLTAFLALAESRHVTRAARMLGLSQPALSHSLRRLREVFDDPLFVRAPSGMAFTPFAEMIAPVVRETLGLLERDVFDRRPFTPSELSRTFRLRTTDYIEALVLPPLLHDLAAQAPRVRIAATPVGPSLPRSELESGACDLAIAGFFEEVPPGMHRQKLLDDTFTCAVRRGHPILLRGVTLDGFCAARHIIVAPGGELSGAVDRALSRRKLAREVAVGTSAFLVSAWICAQSECVLTAPSRLVQLVGPGLGLQAFSPPLTMPGISIAQVWHARSDADPAHRWFRGLVHAAAQRSRFTAGSAVPRSPRPRHRPRKPGSAR